MQSETPTTVAEPRAGSGEMFDRIAPRYDLLNRVISLGVDQGWRRRTVRSLGIGPSARVLDLATGTADLALMIARMHPGAEVVGVDPSRGMLDLGQQKIERAGLAERVSLKQGLAEALPFEDESFSSLTMAFGIRNVEDRPRALSEMLRVLKPGGKAAILELSEPPAGPMGALARLHVHHVVPWVGGVLSGVREYRYLQHSIAAFPPATQFVAAMQQAGFFDVSSHALTFGVCHLYVGTRQTA